MTLLKTLHIILTAAAMTLATAAEAKSSLDKYHEEIVDMSVEENLMSPEVPKKLTNSVKNAQIAMARHLKKKGMQVETARDGLVVVVTLSSDNLFLPNDTTLSPLAPKTLDQFNHYLKTPDLYKILVVAHSDDTGTEEYLNSLTAARADAVVRYFNGKGLPTDGVVPYGFGTDEPVATNISRRGRATNRRIELYFIPGPEMLSLARNQKLN